jgi:curved DNA-binding protein CbpA
MADSEPAIALPSLLGEIYLASRTGVLRMVCEQQRLGLAFHRGRLVRAESLGTEGPAPLPGPAAGDELSRHLARVLTELGIARRVREGGGPRSLPRESLLESLGPRIGEAEFAEEEVPEGEGDGQLTTEQLILEAVGRAPAAAVRAALGDTRRPLGRALNPDFERQLSTSEAYILSRVDGTLCAAEVLQLVPDHEEGERSLLGMLLTGLVELLEPPSKPASPPPAPVSIAGETPVAPAEELDEATKAARARVEAQRRDVLQVHEALASSSHFEILGVSETASEAEIKQAYFQKVKKSHPDQFRDPGFADIADRIEAVFLRVQGAYEVLSDPQSRQSYEAVLKRRRAAENPPARPAEAAAPSPAGATEGLIDTAENAWMAEEAIHRAERLIAEPSKVWGAIQLLQAVIPRIYGRKQRERARVLLAKAYIKNPNWVRRGEELLQKVIQEDPQNAEAHYALGLLYKESGMSSRAVNMFKKALELRPEHKQARAELNSLSGPLFLKKWFGKG